jgi:hypothetical protein
VEAKGAFVESAQTKAPSWLAWAEFPAAKLLAPCAELNIPPGTVENDPLALFASPPPTVEPGPLASLKFPPPMVDAALRPCAVLGSVARGCFAVGSVRRLESA